MKTKIQLTLGYKIFISALTFVCLTIGVQGAEAVKEDLFHNPFNKNSAHHRPIGTGAVYANDSHPVTVVWKQVKSPFINDPSPHGSPYIASKPTDPVVVLIHRSCPTWNHNPKGLGFPITLRLPPNFPPNAKECTDSSANILNPDTGIVSAFYELVQATHSASIVKTWDARGLGHGSVLGQRVGTSASGATPIMGAVRAHELNTPGLKIMHAFHLAVPGTKAQSDQTHLPELISRNIQWPAVSVDGQVVNASANNGLIPYGALMAIPPVSKGGPDLKKLGLSEPGLRFAEALRDYGTYVIDSAGGVVFRAADPLGANGNLVRQDLKKFMPYLRLVLNSVNGANAHSVGLTTKLTGSIGTPTWPAGGGTPLAPNSAFDAGGPVAPVVTGDSVTGTVGVAFSYQIVASGSPTSYSATGLPAGLSLNTKTGLITGKPTAAVNNVNVTLRATNATGTGSGTLKLTIHQAVPSAPSALNASVVSGVQINLSWSDQSNNETDFKIERMTGSGGTFEQIALVGVNMETYNDVGLTPDTQYSYRVRAVNNTGDSAYSNTVSAATPVIITKPSTPSDVSASTVSSTQIDLNWMDNSNNETNFRILRREGSSGSYSYVKSLAANVTTTHDTGLKPNTEYDYKVRAMNGSEGSGYSNAAHATTLKPPVVVSLSVTDDQTSEYWHGAAIWKVTRVGDATEDLTVNYTVGGTATNGVDYRANTPSQTLTGTIVIPAGSDSALIKVWALSDTIKEPNETIVVTLKPEADYDIGIPDNGTVLIKESAF